MCLIALAHNISPDLPLVLAANRDEDYDRPTLAAGFWSEAPNLIALSLLQFLGTPSAGARDVEGQVFVTSDRYGTRSSTVIVATADEIHFAERSYSRGGAPDGGGVRLTITR